MAKDDIQSAEFEQKLIRDIVMKSHKLQKKQFRWGLFFKLAFLAYILWITFTIVPGDGAKSGVHKTTAHTALIQINGMIAAEKEASADNIVTSLRKAFENKHVKGIVLRINSPGGSAVQAFYVYDEIIRLKKAHPDIKVYSTIMDVGASGGYFIAVGADEIYANKASLVGSIGALLDSFGFVNTMDKIGVERRLITAGKNKGFMDPFSPVNPQQIAFAKSLVKNVHKQFIEVVKTARGERLSDSPEIFSGLVWTGEQALDLGLIDGFGSASYIAREIIGAEEIVDYTTSDNLFNKFAEKIGVAMQPFSLLFKNNSEGVKF